MWSLHLHHSLLPLRRAHDGDVKEASKQKCQQQNPPVVSAVFHGPGPVSAVPGVPQYLHGATLQYPQQNCQPLLSSAHGPSSYMPQTNLQAGTQPLGHLQHIPASLETKVSMPFNRGYQVNAHYKCSSPCFDRWLNQSEQEMAGGGSVYPFPFSAGRVDGKTKFSV